MNKLKRLGNATELEFALARTPIMMVIVLTAITRNSICTFLQCNLKYSKFFCL